MENELLFFLKGLIIGFTIAAPVGPIGILCIHRTLYQGRVYGFLTGLGAATADMMYGFIAGFGLTFISNFLMDQKIILQIAGGGFLVYIGLKIFSSKPQDSASSSNKKGLLSSYLITFFLTITNPITILSFIGIFAGLGVGSMENPNYFLSFLLVIGVFLGSACWWIILTGLAGIFRERINPTFLKWINRLSGIFILCFGLLVIFSFM
ncbi:LysE family translocator [Chengkuizengella sediminis]|uniref:LysE family translocator n=1 Tax=Chengkuizengella sediminis TaxID=1885917 RepID=UPI001389DF00|nr:LysE family translocator [Chengkuizengella sediminis]NDI33890.1 LysE family translocator [Chengkuizengella sediminis]